MLLVSYFANKRQFSLLIIFRKYLEKKTSQNKRNKMKGNKGHSTRSVPVYAYTLSGEYIIAYNSITEASIALNMPKQRIIDMLDGTLYSNKGFVVKDEHTVKNHMTFLQYIVDARAFIMSKWIELSENKAIRNYDEELLLTHDDIEQVISSKKIYSECLNLWMMMGFQYGYTVNIRKFRENDEIRVRIDVSKKLKKFMKLLEDKPFIEQSEMLSLHLGINVRYR